MLAHWYTLLLAPSGGVPALTEASISAAVWASPLPGVNPVGLAGAMLADVYAMMFDVWQRLGLDPANPLTTNKTAGTIAAGGVSQQADESTPNIAVITRLP